MTNYNLSQDLEILLKDVSLDKGLLHFGFNTTFDFTQPDSVELLKIEFYKIYNRSNSQKYNIKFPRKKLVLDYVEILNNIEKPSDRNNWYIKNQVGYNAVRTQRGFSEKVFSNNGFNPSIEKFVLSEKEIVSFEYPYYYLKDGYFWLLAQNLLTITNDQLFRFYFNLSGDNLEGISILLRFLLNEFDSRNISYRAKAPIFNEQFNKADSFVLYIDKVHIDIAIDLIKALQKDICIYLRDEIPLFTKEIFKGVGFAEEPQDDINQSFGKVKISEIVEILKDINKKNPNTKIHSPALILQISTEIHKKFYLNKDSYYTDSISKILSSKSLLIKRNLDARPREIIEKSIQNIAYQLCSSAISYDENQINWLVGTRNFKDLMSNDRVILKCSKNTFYDGKLGIGWFLVHSFQFSHDFTILKTCKLIKNNLIIELKNNPNNYFETAYYLLETEKILIKILTKEELDYFGLLENNVKNSIVIKVHDFKCDPNDDYYNILWYLEILFSNVESLALNESGTVSKLKSTIQDKLKSFYESLFNTTPVIDKNYSLIIRYCLCEKAIQLKKIGFEGYDREAGKHLLERLKIIDTKFELVENIILMNSIDRLTIGPELRDLIEGRINNYFNTFNENKSKPKSIGNALDYVLLNQSVEIINVKLKYEKQNLWDSVSKDYINSITKDFISNNIFPDLGLAQDFYNSGINEGIAGVGYLLLFSLLNKDELSLLPSHCFLDYSELQSPKKALDGNLTDSNLVLSDFGVPVKGSQSWSHHYKPLQSPE